jgi:hypothetical protein
MNLDRPELQDVVFFIPPVIGALLGARYAQGQTVRERVLSYGLSAAMGIFVGAGLGEYFSLGRWATGGLQFFVAAIGMEALAYVIAALRQGITDPASTAGKWIDAILGRRRDG